MFRNFIKALLFVVFVTINCLTLHAQKIKEPKPGSVDWVKPYEPFRIVGNLYYVGTYDLACYFIKTSNGNILINTGLAASIHQIKENIKKLGFNYADIKLLLNTQAHYDHLGAMADVKRQTGAKLLINEKDAAEVKSGGSTDYALGGKKSTFKPIHPDRLLKNGDTVSLGETKLVMLHHPGHTKGSCSFLFTVDDAQQRYKVLIANLPTIVTDSSFKAIPAYPAIAADYAYTLNEMKKLSFDLWVASHASQFDLHKKRKPGDSYNPLVFKDQAGYDAALADLQNDYEEKLKQ